MENATPWKYYLFNTYSHQLIGSIYNGLLQYISNTLFAGQRFKTTVISTYQKAVQDLNQNNTNYTAYYPVLIIDPSFPIGPSEESNKNLQRFPVGGGLSGLIYDTILQSDTAFITPGYTRIKTSISVIMVLDSIMEHLDCQMRMIQAFNGIGKDVRPFSITAMNPVPIEVITQSGNFSIDWSTIAPPSILDVTGQQYNMLPVFIQPYFRLENIGDGSEKYGGTSDPTNIRVTFDLTVEADILSFFIIESNYNISQVTCTLIPQNIFLISNTSQASFGQGNVTNINNGTIEIVEPIFLLLTQNVPVDVTSYVNQGFNVFSVVINGQATTTGYTVVGNVYTLTICDQAYLLIYKT